MNAKISYFKDRMSERGIDDNLAKISQKVTKGNILENKSELRKIGILTLQYNLHGCSQVQKMFDMRMQSKNKFENGIS